MNKHLAKYREDTSAQVLSNTQQLTYPKRGLARFDSSPMKATDKEKQIPVTKSPQVQKICF